jgi:tetratricopeptide (TPR) repeat protein
MISLPAAGFGQDLLEAALADYKRGDVEDSYTLVNEIIEAKPTATAYMLRADCLHKMGKLGPALDDYDRARINGYTGDEFSLHRGICKASIGLYEESKQDLMVYLHEHPDDAKAYYWIGSVEYMMMEQKAALRYLDEALLLDSAYADAYYLRAATFADMGKTLAAYEDFKTALNLKPELLRAKMYMATLLMDLGNYQQAVEILSEVSLEKIDFLSELLYYRGHAYFNLHNLDGACNDWVESAQLGDEDAEASYKKACRDKAGVPRLKRKNYIQF